MKTVKHYRTVNLFNYAAASLIIYTMLSSNLALASKPSNTGDFSDSELSRVVDFDVKPLDQPIDEKSAITFTQEALIENESSWNPSLYKNTGCYLSGGSGRRENEFGKERIFYYNISFRNVNDSNSSFKVQAEYPGDYSVSANSWSVSNDGRTIRLISKITNGAKLLQQTFNSSVLKNREVSIVDANPFSGLLSSGSLYVSYLPGAYCFNCNEETVGYRVADFSIDSNKKVIGLKGTTIYKLKVNTSVNDKPKVQSVWLKVPQQSISCRPIAN